jgi:hypothetical protein
VLFSHPVFSTFGTNRGTYDASVASPALPSIYGTIRVTGSLAANTTLTIPPEDGWSARVLDLTTRNGFTLSLAAATAAGLSVALTNQQTQRLYMELDPAASLFNVRAESPPA